MNLWHFSLIVLFVHCETLFKICLCVFVLSNPTSFSGCPFIIMHIQHIYFMWLLIVIYDYTNMDVQHHFLKTANLSPEWNQFNHMQKLGSKKKCCFLFVSVFFFVFLGGGRGDFADWKIYWGWWFFKKQLHSGHFNHRQWDSFIFSSCAVNNSLASSCFIRSQTWHFCKDQEVCMCK